nr:hypothetical protein [Tanacetum cinerariifolium]
GLDVYDSITNLEYEKNLISNEFVVKLGLQYEVKKNGEKVVNREGVIFRRSFLRLTKAIVDFESGILTIYPDFITFNFDLDDELDVYLLLSMLKTYHQVT